MVDVTLYTKDPCPLCDEVKHILASLEPTYPHQLQEVDITQDAETFAYYRFIIPVVKIGGRTLKAPMNMLDLSDALRVAFQNK